MIRREDIIEIGRFNKTHGVNGEISATFDCELEDLAGISCYICEVDGIFVPFFAEGTRPKNNQTVLLKIEGIDNNENLKILVNKKIYALKEEIKAMNCSIDDDELPLEYFIGFGVSDTELGDVGVISDVDTSTDNYLFIVEKNDKQYFIPAVDELIVGIDFDNKSLEMDLPKGLLEM